MTTLPGQPEKAVILIVDDEPFMRNLLAGILGEAGFCTEAVGSGPEAVAFIKTTQPELILLDLVMPGMDGFATCTALRQVPGATLLPIVMVTGQDDNESIHLAFESGITDFVTKPIKPELLVNRIRFTLKANQDLKHLAMSQARLADAQRIASLGNWEWGIRDDSLWWSEEIHRIFSPFPPDFTPSLQSFFHLVHPQDHKRVAASFRRCLTGKAPLDLEHRVLRHDNSQRFVRTRGELVLDPSGKPLRLFGIMQDITERHQAEDQLLLLKEAMECLPIGITISDVTGKIVYVNPSEAGMHGFTTAELLAQTARTLGPKRLEQPLTSEDLGKLKLWKRESFNRRKSGEEFPVQLSSLAVKNNRGEFIGMVTACEDITERKNAEKKITQLAFFDTLTGLPNRWMFRDRLSQALALGRRDHRGVALLFLDLDRFKFINDTMGHDFGDLLLKAVALRLDECMRKADTVARLGGDEFVVLLTGVEGQAGISKAARRILEAFAKPFELEARTIFSAPSIGIAMFPDDGENIDDLLKNADAAMYHAKSFGGDTFRFYSREINQKIQEKMALESQLRRALDEQEFVLYYQPQVAMATGCLVGVEALVRWQHPEHGLVLPSQFIPVLEDTGLIFRLGEWVLRTACLQARAWQDSFLPGLRMGINISACQFRQAGFLDLVDTILQETGVNPDGLEFELTESMVMDEPEKAIETLRRIKDRGIHLSIDDFGTGYSSLSYLKNFPIDRLKIDRSFLLDVTNSRDDAAIVEAIILMASSLNLKVIAEGVENQAQHEFLLHRGCHETQGFLFSKPLPAESLARLLSQGSLRPAEPDAAFSAP